MSELALQLINEAKKANAKVLDLGNCSLTELPDELFDLKNLEELNLCYKYWDYELKEWIESKNKEWLNRISDINERIGGLNNLKTLRLFGLGILDISFLEKLKRLQILDLNYNQISKYSFLEKLTELQTLSLSDNQISDISFLKNLTRLKRLSIGINQISDTSHLEKLTELQWLGLDNNRISDISFLENLIRLQTLDLGRNKISDISFLENLVGLQWLGLCHNKILDASFLTNLTGLQILDLGNNKITDTSFLKKLAKLQELHLGYNQISKYSFLKNLINLQTLDVSYNKIPDISFLENLTGLQWLLLSGNQIIDISYLEKLTELKMLDLGYNQISDISILKRLTALQSLLLSRNQISDISFLKKLTELQRLDLGNNQISDISFLKKLIGLHRLDLSSNQISDISFLKKLIGLQRLDLSSNQISDYSILEKLTGLQWLGLNENQVSDISFLEELTKLQWLELYENKISNISILEKLTSLQWLDLNSNQISDISILEKLTELQTLNLNSNQITNIELSFLDKLPKLIKLQLYNNPLKSIDESIVDDYNNCLVDLRNYLEDSEAGKKINNSFKLILVGNGGVGKTQIAKRMVEGEKFTFNENHDSTHAVNLLKKNLSCDFIESGLEVTLWDFGGQDLYHSTHRMFLQTKAIFVLIWDWDSEMKLHHEYLGKKYKNEKRQYWLEYIKHFSGNSPVILIQNKVDHDEDSKNGIPEPLQVAYQEEYYVEDVVQLSAKTGRNFSVLQHVIIELFKNNKKLKSALLKELPNSWVAIRQKIYDDIGKGLKTIDYGTFETYCDEQGIKKSTKSVLNFLHNTGVLFFRSGYFKNEIIVDQAWAIEAVYKVLNKESSYYEILKHKKGHFGYDDISVIWKNYTDEEKELFIDFMLSCDLCLEITRNKTYKTPLTEREFVIPQFLPPKPDEVETYCQPYNITKSLTFRQYRFLPAVYIQRFIVKAGNFAAYKFRWENGVLVHYEQENAYAIVEAAYETKSIHIRYSPNSKKLLEVIKNELEKIEGEGKVRPKKQKEGFDEIAFAENLYFKDLKPNASMNKPKKIFISYSKHDVEAVEQELIPDLRNLEKQSKISIWYDKKLLAGSEWDPEIKKQLQEADIILFVVSRKFISTDYIWDVEIENAIKRHDKGEATVIPIILSPCDWTGDATPFSKLNAIPSKGKPISKFDNEDDAWLEVLQAIKKVIG